MLFLPKEVETVITTLQGAGYSPYLVGGCVREMLRVGAPDGITARHGDGRERGTAH